MTGACQVAVVGSFMMDLAVVAPRRPRPGETLVGSSFGAFLGGKGCNQAIVASRVGASAAMIGRLGADDFGRRFLACLSAERIDVTHVTVDEVEGTGVGLPLIEDGGENSIVVVPRANGRMTVADVTAAIGTISTASVLLLQLELPLDVVVEAAARARAAGTLVVLNPAPSPGAGEIDSFAGLVDVLIPNEVEVAALSGVDDPRQGAVLLRERLGCTVVVTMGEQGAWVVDGGEPARYPAYQVEVVDTVGAGDAFCGSLGARLATGAPLRDAVEYASAAAALAVTKLGAEPGMPRAVDIDALRRAASPGG